ncbi:hypothetical protein SAMN04515620_102115 [Collimonas sp. OK607]|nr:hypothetical protein SAMN04515620_102115 [Collimonas sp. OK607]
MAYIKQRGAYWRQRSVAKDVSPYIARLIPQNWPGNGRDRSSRKWTLVTAVDHATHRHDDPRLARQTAAEAVRTWQGGGDSRGGCLVELFTASC